VVRSEEQARRISSARQQRSEDYRRLQLLSGLRSQRTKEAEGEPSMGGCGGLPDRCLHALPAVGGVEDPAAEERRQLRLQRASLLAQRKRASAAKLAEVSAKLAALKAGSSSGEAAAKGPGGGGREGLGAGPPADPAAQAPSPEEQQAGRAAEGEEAMELAQLAAAAAVQVQEVRLVLKADTQGSVEAVRALALQQASPHVRIKVLHAGVGPLGLTDVQLATASGAHLVLFNLGGQGQGGGSNRADLERAMQTAKAAGVQGGGVEMGVDKGLEETGGTAMQTVKAAGVQVLSHNVVYHLIEQIQGVVSGAMPFLDVEEVTGTAAVVASFPLSSSGRKAAELPEGGGRIAGVRVTSGSLRRTCHYVRVVRNGQEVYRGPCSSLRRHKLDVDVVGSGTECGLVLDGGRWSDFQEGDVLESVELVKRRADVV
ncbi:hypothetical protein V8C86DRAFT_3177170, partial [Haematococcus lacustris]